MSNLSDIGFAVESQEEWLALLERVQPHTVEVKAQGGSYFHFDDPSGAQLWMQVNPQRELIGMNPHFEGPSRRTVLLTRLIERKSPMDGGFYGWANPVTSDVASATLQPASENDAQGDYPFVFHVPDFQVVDKVSLPSTLEVQLSAFASGDLGVFDDEEAYAESQLGEVKFAPESFIPSGLFTTNEEGEMDSSLAPQPYGLFAGTITACEPKQNAFTREKFWWMAVRTLGGMIDVVAAPHYVQSSPHVGGIVIGSFYLSGRLQNVPLAATKARFSWGWRRG